MDCFLAHVGRSDVAVLFTHGENNACVLVRELHMDRQRLGLMESWQTATGLQNSQTVGCTHNSLLGLALLSGRASHCQHISPSTHTMTSPSPWPSRQTAHLATLATDVVSNQQT